MIDRRIRYMVGLDTETCNGLNLADGKVDLTQSLVYDIGWAVTDKRGKIYKTRSFVVAETFLDMKDVMKSAYYAEKIPRYWEDIKAGTREIKTLMSIRKILFKDMKEYNINIVFAHNASFDVRALNNTVRYVTKSHFRWFFAYGTEIWDTLKMARQAIGKQKSYITWCVNNGYLTKHKVPRVRLTAEILYRYLSGNKDFIESHTGLEDVIIETKIMAHCLRQHKKLEKRLY